VTVGSVDGQADRYYTLGKLKYGGNGEVRRISPPWSDFPIHGRTPERRSL
jgi:hypothetical protein